MATVVLLTEGYGYIETVSGMTGRKIYLDSAAYVSPPSPVDLPEIGDSWSLDLLGLRAYEIEVELIDPGCSTIKKYFVNYSTIEILADGEDDEFPVTVEQSADYVTYTDTAGDYADQGHWVWPDDERANDFRIRKREVTTTIVIHRKVIETSNFLGFLKVSNSMVGKVNEDTEFAKARTGLTFPIESLLYAGCSSNEARTKNGKKIWQVQMRFVLKDPGGTWAEDGWQKVYRPAKDAYQIVKHSDTGNKLYETVKFTDLFQNSSFYD